MAYLLLSFAGWYLVMHLLVLMLIAVVVLRCQKRDFRQCRAEVGLPEVDLGYGKLQKCSLVILCLLAVGMYPLGLLRIVSAPVLGGLGLLLLFVGAALQAAAHGGYELKAAGGYSNSWGYVDHLGKVMAYVGAILALLASTLGYASGG